MENTTTRAIDTTDQAWKADREKAIDCPYFEMQSLVDGVLDRWKSASIGYKAMAYAQMDRAKNLSLARSLREAEQTIFAVVVAALPSYQEDNGHRMHELMAALSRCRMLIVLPVCFAGAALVWRFGSGPGPRRPDTGTSPLVLKRVEPRSAAADCPRASMTLPAELDAALEEGPLAAPNGSESVVRAGDAARTDFLP